MKDNSKFGSKKIKISSIIFNCISQSLDLLSRWVYFNLNFGKLKRRKKTPKIDVLFSSDLISWRDYIHKNGKVFDYDLMIGDVFEESKKHFKTFGLDRTNRRRQIHLTFKKFKSSDDWICYEEFMSVFNIAKAILLYFKASFGYPSDPELTNFFRIIKKEPSVFRYLYLLMSKDIITELNPKIVFMTCEYCFFHRELTYISRLKGKKILALQHGELNKDVYYFNDSNIKKVLPDITCIFGKKHFNILTKVSIYSPEMLEITGNPRYDVLRFANKIYSKKKLLDKYKLDPRKKIILWTTQTQGLSLDENRKNIDAVYSAMRTISNAQLVIKLHPTEDQDYPLYIENNTYKPKIFGGNIDTYSLIYISDVVITRHSTTAIESIILKKPIIILNLSGEPDPVDYVKEDLALGVYDPQELKPNIIKLINQSIKFDKNREKYIQKYLFKFDGKATSRVLKVIRDKLKDYN